MVPSEVLEIDPDDFVTGDHPGEPVLEEGQVGIYGVRDSGEWGLVRVEDCIEVGAATICN